MSGDEGTGTDHAQGVTVLSLFTFREETRIEIDMNEQLERLTKLVEEDEDYASMVGADQLARQFGLSDGQTKLLTKMFNKVAGAALKGGLRNRLMGRDDDEVVIDVTPRQDDVDTGILHGALALDAHVDMNTPCVAKLAKMDGSAYYVFNWDGDDTIKAYYVDGEGNNGMITASYRDVLMDGYEPISYKETLGEIKDNEDF